MANSTFGPIVGQTTYPMHSIGSNAPREDQALGLKAIYNACRNLYPDQPTPLQVTALRKFWMGGPDPLDFINMYSNQGSSELGSPPHWHYVSNGLSDLYGDARLHSHCVSADQPSGFGFELTLRIRREPMETHPPTWPAHLLQSLARYVFHSQAQLMVGDHIPWPSALDKQPYSQTHQSGRSRRSTKNSQSPSDTEAQSIAIAAAAAAASLLTGSGAKSGDSRMTALTNPNTYASMVAAALAAVQSAAKCNDSTKSVSTDDESRIHHMLVVEDAQLKKISTPYGYIQFLQLVGLCEAELRLVQRWTGNRVIDIMRKFPETGGGLLVTDMNRKLSLFDLEPTLADHVTQQLRLEGSNLSGVTTQYFAWAPISLSKLGELLPGESEAERERHHESSIIRSPEFGSKDATEGQDNHVPTDLSVSRLLKAYQGPVAMDAEDTIVPCSTKKDMEEDDFVDVVGDSSSSSLVGAKPSSGTNEMDASSITMSVAESSHEKQESLPSRVSQSVSASGTSSAWCSRISKPRVDPATSSDSKPETPSDITSPLTGPLGFRASGPQGSNSLFSGGSRNASYDQRGSHTPGSTGEGSAPCTPLAHLSLSPASLDLLPARVIECLDVHLCWEAGEMLPLAVNDRLKHGKHFTFLNSHFPDHAITLVPNGVTGAFVSEENPYVARGPWLQILLPEDFLETLEFQFSSLQHMNDAHLPLVFRWPERRLRICLVHPTNSTVAPTYSNAGCVSTPGSLLPKAVAMGSPDTTHHWSGLHSPSNKSDLVHSAPRSPRSVSIPRPNGPVSQPHPFPYFPPGCIPPPAMLAAMFNPNFPNHFKEQLPNRSATGSSQGSGGNTPQTAVDDMKAYWLQLLGLMNKCDSSIPHSGVMSEAMGAALSAIQQTGSHPGSSRSGKHSAPSVIHGTHYAPTP